jgi:hypothetical protein
MKQLFTFKNIAIGAGLMLAGGVLAWKWTPFDNVTTKLACMTPGFKPAAAA